MGWAQGIRHILLDEDLLQNEGKLGEKGFLKGSVCAESTRIACLQPQSAASLHAAMPIIQHHLEHGRKVEPGRAGQIGRPVDQTHLAVPGAAVVTRLLKAGPFPHEQIDDLDIVHEFRAAPLPDGGTGRLQQIFRRLFVDPQAEFGIIQRELAPGTEQQPGKLVGGITAIRQLAPDAGVFPVGIAFIDLDPGRRRLDTHELRHVQPQAVQQLQGLIFVQAALLPVLLVKRIQVLIHAAVADDAAVQLFQARHQLGEPLGLQGLVERTGGLPGHMLANGRDALQLFTAHGIATGRRLLPGKRGIAAGKTPYAFAKDHHRPVKRCLVPVVGRVVDV